MVIVRYIDGKFQIIYKTITPITINEVEYTPTLEYLYENTSFDYGLTLSRLNKSEKEYIARTLVERIKIFPEEIDETTTIDDFRIKLENIEQGCFLRKVVIGEIVQKD